MAVEVMGKPLEKMKRIRSLDEILTRGGQAFSVYREQVLGGADIPTDEEFVRLIDAGQFGKAPIIAESLWQKFYNNGDKHFFPPLCDPESSASSFRIIFGEKSAEHFIDAANRIVDGKIDLLGLKDLNIGIDVDWHREPLSGKRSPLKHWKDFDDLDSTETGNKKIIWELNRHQHFFTLGVAFCLTNDERFGVAFAEHLESWMEQNPPGMGVNWSSSLEISFRAMSWIWAFHLFKNSDHFTPELFKKATKYLYLQGRHIEQYLSKYYSPNTHLTGEGLGLYYLGTQLPFFERAKDWKKVGEDILLAEIEKQILPDGVYFEQSTWYQRYTVDFFSHFAILRSLSDESPATPDMENRLQKAFECMGHFTLPNRHTPLIGDDDGGRMLPLTDAEPDDFRGSLAVGAALFHRGDLKYIAGKASPELFWLMGPEGIQKYESIEEAEPTDGSIDFADGGYCVMRDGYDETDNYLIVDCGEVGSLSAGHGHADALSIEVALQGKSLFVDPGTYSYHESSEARDHFRSSMAHNTISINGRSSSEPGNAFGWKTRADCHRKEWISEERFDFFEGSHDGYERLINGATHTRSILFLKGDYWIMRDLVETTGEHDFSLNFQYSPDRKPQISENGGWVSDDSHRMFTFGDSGIWRQADSFVSKNHGDKVDATSIKFLSRGNGTQEFFTFILPVAEGVEAPEVFEVSIQAGRAFVIKYNGYTDAFIFNEVSDQYIETGAFDSNFKYSWARIRQDETTPDEFVLIDGSGLRIGEHEIFDESQIPFASARRMGNELYIKTDEGRHTASLGPAERRQGDRRQTSSDRRSSK
ncbi:MAG: alginate lyase family protein [Chloracidobacterium sp.]|nr:alginate lyase family protein [Chloracidobacterium sp.]